MIDNFSDVIHSMSTVEPEYDVWPKFKIMEELDRRGIAYDPQAEKYELLTLLNVHNVDDGPEPEPATLPDLFTDMRLKEYFARVYGNVVRYVPGIGWHFWNSQRWITDAPGGLYPLVGQMQKSLMDEASKIVNEKDRIETRKALINLESHNRQTNLIDACQHVPELITAAAEFDRDSMLLNCQNVTINLVNGVTRPHNPQDHITRMVNIEYDPDAQCPVFLAFLTWAMCDDMDLVSYIQRFIGYCLTGKTTEQILDFWYGTGGNGKSTLMNVLQWLLCDYASNADTSLIMKRDNGSDNTRNSMLAGLRGARLITLSEVNDGEKLDEAQIKSFTGGDAVTCRHLYQKPFSYVPQGKLVGFGNYRPHIRGTDHGIWRRIHLVPFRAVITDADKDPNLPDKLRAELPGILAWAVKGCMEWQRRGLDAPKAIKAAVSDYRAKEDTFKSWLSECCAVTEDKRTSAAALMASFRDYSGWRGLSDKKFGDMLREAGFQKIRSNGIFWQGISLDLERLEPLTPIPETFLAKESLGKFMENAPDRSTVPFWQKGELSESDIFGEVQP